MAWSPATGVPAEADHVALDRTRRPVPERRRPARDLCGPRAARGEGAQGAEQAGSSRARVEGVTLDEVLSGAWEALSHHEPASCPMCGAAMRPRYGGGAVVLGGRCGVCVTTLR